MVSVLLCCTRGADGARSRLRRATGRTVAGAKRAACRCRHRPDPRPADGKRPLLSRHARDLRAPSRAQSVAVDVPEKSRFELRLGGHLIGLAAYRRRKGRIAFTHTEVDESCEGRGFGSLLAAAALENAEREGLEVAPLCPFMAHYIKRHPEYEPLLASGYADR